MHPRSAALLLALTAPLTAVAAPLDLCQPPSIAPGQTVTVQVGGANPGEAVTLARGNGPGQTCIAALGGQCLGITGVAVLGSTTADNQGVATFTLNIPATVPVGANIGVQAAIRRGAGGASSVLSDPFFTQIAREAGGQDCGAANVCADADGDGDGAHDVCDICPGGDDALDGDNDGVPDGCDICPGDDTADDDGDMIPDGCDVCPGGDDLADADMDGAPDACDICAAGDDFIDLDGNGTPDACDNVVDTGLVAWWSFTGQTGVDMSGNGHDISAFTRPAWTTGPGGDALQLRGRAWADVPASADFDLTDGFTISAWVKPDSLASFRSIIARTPRMGALQDWALYLRSDELSVIFNYPTPRVTVVSSAVDIAIGVWTHVTSTWDASTGSVHFYKDGVWTSSATFAGPINSNNVAVVIGSDGSSPNDFFGALDEITVWNRPLEATEIMDLATP